MPDGASQWTDHPERNLTAHLDPGTPGLPAVQCGWHSPCRWNPARALKTAQFPFRHCLHPCGHRVTAHTTQCLPRTQCPSASLTDAD